MAAPCGRGALPLVLIALSGAFLTYNSLLSSRSFLPLPSTSFPGATTASSSSRRLAGGRWLFHTAVTASGSVYNTWQCRVMYHWFKEARRRQGRGGEMGGFTRILHSGKPDEFIDEIPTFVADPLPEGTDQGYIVLNRPWAFVQWLQKADIQEEYILMAEPDHLIVKPIPNLSKDGRAAAFPFFYIEPKKYEKVLRKYFPENEGLITNIDPIGNSPVIIDKESLSRIAPTWMNISIAMKKDPEADKSFGWVLEMYAYAVASALHGVGNILHKDFMIQPPWDLDIGDSFIIHYTYGCDYDMKGKLTYGKIGEWRFDKRYYENKPPPRNLPLPPNGVPQSMITLVKMVNEATANIPNWESYAAD
ncbi:hydroxyproline O-arabinosyltransferase 1 [Brachypodium distachyon]|uniref:Hydroxyproline O-arabinosyltransferase-like domain-containing protein n=1 Tax=Brachypodium distachyon TaxID=15368 RepID=I1H0F8_BRADI|nr:hydroxyproline O-arabinosyltransferase 1 [Brachypodium distachyon]KQK19320.1 hypothetical protein BRADI_1g47590v3 [Brachypodium distachyon]|eukprot:XP_010227959.1 hydroxyproline O-arabinosyltransferase 1 [Brachypodium distachyon]